MPEYRVPLDCPGCDGTGDCQSCNGEDDHCDTCDGVGECLECDGTGEVEDHANG